MKNTEQAYIIDNLQKCLEVCALLKIKHNIIVDPFTHYCLIFLDDNSFNLVPYYSITGYTETVYTNELDEEIKEMTKNLTLLDQVKLGILPFITSKRWLLDFAIKMNVSLSEPFPESLENKYVYINGKFYSTESDKAISLFKILGEELQ